MDEQDLTRFVVSQLSQDIRRNDIVQKVCERGQISWAQAQALVEQIENSHGGAFNVGRMISRMKRNKQNGNN